MPATQSRALPHMRTSPLCFADDGALAPYSSRHQTLHPWGYGAGLLAEEAKIGRQLLTTVPTIANEANLKQRQYLQSLLTSLYKPNSRNSVPLTIHLQESE